MGKKHRNKQLRAQRRAEKKTARNQEREEQRFKEEIIKDAKSDLICLPKILGNDFNTEQNDLELIKHKIDSLPKDSSGYKRRILYISEASYLKTGFSTYLREVLKKLNATSKYELAEFGSYGNSPEVDPLAKGIPWKYYHNNPVNNIEEGEYKKDFKENQFGKWKLSYVLADFKPDIVLCQPPGQIILTSNGYKEIENIKTGDFVLSHKNKFQKVIKTMNRASKNELMGIYVNGISEPIKLTKEHPVLIYRKKKQTTTRKSIKDLYSNEVPVFIKAKNVKLGDLVVMPCLPSKDSCDILEIKNYLVNFIEENEYIRPALHKNDNKIKAKVAINGDFARLLGYLYCDGCIGKSTISISFDNDEERFAQDAIDILYKCFGINSIYRKHNNQNIVYCNSTILCEFFRKLTHNKKQIPPSIMISTKDVKEQFICGCIRADGSYKCGKQIRFHNTNKLLAYSIRSILVSLGFSCTIVKNKIKEKKSLCLYDVCISSTKDIEKAHSFINKYTYVPCYNNIVKSAKKTNIVNGQMIATVKRVRNLDYEGQVFNIEVENDNSYTSLWCLHNCNRDNWMDTYVLKNQFRNNCLVFWMPTVDGYPQKWQWLQDYSQVDGLYTYSWFGKRVLEEQSKTLLAKQIKIPQLHVRNVMQPGVDLNIFKPMNKMEVRKIFGVPSNIRFVGTVMRNQPRKLFPRIIDSFRIFKEKFPLQAKDVMLLLHTSIPDVGWDIPEAVRQNGLEQMVVFSYMCSSCGLLAVSTFCGSPAQCPACNKPTFHTPNTRVGYQDEHFAYIYNLMDVYIQGSIAEGDGMPVNEAKACGVPTLCSDFSALYEKNRNGGGLPIINETIYTEHETMQWRSLFDRNDLAEKLADLIGNEDKRSRLAKEARECAEKFYNWDLCAAKWIYEIDSAKIKNRKETWEKSVEIKKVSELTPPDIPNNAEGYKQWLNWCYINILGRPKGVDSDGLQYWSRIIDNAPNKEKTKEELEKHFRKMVDSENESKRILADPKSAISDPIQKIKNIIEETEGIKL